MYTYGNDEGDHLSSTQHHCIYFQRLSGLFVPFSSLNHQSFVVNFHVFTTRNLFHASFFHHCSMDPTRSLPQTRPNFPFFSLQQIHFSSRSWSRSRGRSRFACDGWRKHATVCYTLIDTPILEIFCHGFFVDLRFQCFFITCVVR